jgi:hypothetical protein
MQTLTVTMQDDQAASALLTLLRGMARVSVRLVSQEPTPASVSGEYEAPQSVAAAPKRYTLAELDAIVANNPDISALHGKPGEADWSWLPAGKTKDTVTLDDIRDMRLKERYGI